MFLTQRWLAAIHNVEHDLSLTTLVAGSDKISLTSLSTSDTNYFWDEFNDEISFIASFIPTTFHQQYVSKLYIGFQI